MGEWEKTRKRETVSGKGREEENKGHCVTVREREGERKGGRGRKRKREGTKERERGKIQREGERGRQHNSTFCSHNPPFSTDLKSKHFLVKFWL